MLRMALRDIIASVTAFLNCLRRKNTEKHVILWENPLRLYDIAQYII